MNFYFIERLRKRDDWGNLKTTSFTHESMRPHYAGTIARRAFPTETPDFVDDGEGWLFASNVERPDLEPTMGYVKDDPTDKLTIRQIRLAAHNSIRHRGAATGFAHTILPRSLREFMRRRGYSDNEIDSIIADNYTSHHADMEETRTRQRPDLKSEIYRRPVYLFSPEAHKAMMRHLERTSDVFGGGGYSNTKTPIEQGVSLIGSMSIDTETGTPFVHITHIVPVEPRQKYTTRINGWDRPEHKEKIRSILKKNPHLFEVGMMHSHPPGGIAALSVADKKLSMRNLGLINPYNLVGTHVASTIRVPGDSNFLSGTEAKEYLLQNAREIIPPPQGTGTSRPYGSRYDSSAQPRGYGLYDANNRMHPVTQTSATAFYSGYHGGIQAPRGTEPVYLQGNVDQNDVRRKIARHPLSFLGWRLATSSLRSAGTVSFPNQVVFLGREPAPNTIGTNLRFQATAEPFTVTGEQPEYAHTLRMVPTELGHARGDDENRELHRRQGKQLIEDPYSTITPAGRVGYSAPRGVPVVSERPRIPTGSRAEQIVEQGGTPAQEAIASRIRETRASEPIKTVSKYTKAFPFAIYPGGW
jgi:hypothetical protein